MWTRRQSDGMSDEVKTTMKRKKVIKRIWDTLRAKATTENGRQPRKRLSKLELKQSTKYERS